MLLIVITALALLTGTLVCAVKGAFALGFWVWLLPVTALGVFLALLAAGFLFLMYLCKKVDQDVPQEEDDKFYRLVTDLIIESAFWVLRIHVKKSGLERCRKTAVFCWCATISTKRIS